MNIDRALLKNHQDVGGAPPLPPDGRRPVAEQLNRPAPLRTSDIAPAPRPTQPRPAQPVAPPTPPVAGNTNISININMPKFKKPTLPDWDYKRIRKWAVVIVGLIVASFILHAVVSAVISHNKANAAKHRVDMINQRQNPTFKPLLPATKTAAVAKTAAYDPKRDSYSYNDTIKGMSVIVSQQPLPSGNDIAKIAKSMNATTPIIASKGTAYMASSAGGAQTVVMGSGSLLVFVQSAFTHSIDDWKGYLDTLQS